jgi:hypothetical protein
VIVVQRVHLRDQDLSDSPLNLRENITHPRVKCFQRRTSLLMGMLLFPFAEKLQTLHGIAVPSGGKPLRKLDANDKRKKSRRGGTP